MKKKRETVDEIAFWEAGSKAFKLFISGFVLALGLLSAFAFLMRLNALQADDFAVLLFAIAFFTLSYLMFAFFLNPRVLITAEALHVRNFWGVKRWKLSEIEGLVTKKEKLKPRQGTGKTVVPVVVEWVVLQLKNGRSARFIAPGFVGNDRLLAVLADRLEVKVSRDHRRYEEIPLGESPFK